MASGIISYFEYSVNSHKIIIKYKSHSYEWLRKDKMDLKDIINIPTSDLVIELLHRKEIDVIFVENNDKAFIDTSCIKGYTNEDNRYIEDSALILIYKD